MKESKHILAKLGQIKYPLLMLALGVALLLFPGKSAPQKDVLERDQLLQQTLARTEGVGEVWVITSENGAVVVCEGAENAKARLDILRAVYAYTGFTSDKITVLKLAHKS